jgi:hypothetical protein
LIAYLRNIRPSQQKGFETSYEALASKYDHYMAWVRLPADAGAGGEGDVLKLKTHWYSKDKKLIKLFK